MLPSDTPKDRESAEEAGGLGLQPAGGSLQPGTATAGTRGLRTIGRVGERPGSGTATRGTHLIRNVSDTGVLCYIHARLGLSSNIRGGLCGDRQGIAVKAPQPQRMSREQREPHG